MTARLPTSARVALITTMIPSAPRTISVETIRERLRDHGVDISLRGVQRDLAVLRRVLPIVEVAGSRPYLVRWADGAKCGRCGGGA